MQGLFQQVAGGSSLCLCLSRSFGGLAAPVMRKTNSVPEYFVYLDEESLSAKQKIELASPPPAKKASEIPSMKEEVVFNFGASFRTYMKKSESLRFQHAKAEKKSVRSADPFEDIPFRGLAEYLGGSYLDAMEQTKEDKKTKGNSHGNHNNKPMQRSEDIQAMPVPRFLPFTSCFAKTDAFKSTFVVDDDKSKRRTRLSWYNPQDGMVPTNWLKDGLLADLKWYKPFAEGNGWRN